MPDSTKHTTPRRRLAVGAEVQPQGGVHFRVWAPLRRQVNVEVQDISAGKTLASSPLNAESDGYFSGYLPDAGAGSRYGFRLDDGDQLFPDPVSRLQPDGPTPSPRWSI